METKLDSAVNLLSANSKKLSTLNEWGACLKAQPVFTDNNYQTSTDFSNHPSSYYSMDRDDLHSLESIKKAMLEHDHLFKQQVKELHKLYGVQRMLMNELKSKVPDQTRASHANLVEKACFDLQQCAQEPSAGRQDLEENEKEAETELTLGIGNRKYSDRGIKKKYKAQPHCNVDLLLYPISTSDQFQEIRQRKGLSDGEERSLSVEDCGENVVISDQARKRPHWLLQSLGSHNT